MVAHKRFILVTGSVGAAAASVVFHEPCRARGALLPRPPIPARALDDTVRVFAPRYTSDVAPLLSFRSGDGLLDCGASILRSATTRTYPNQGDLEFWCGAAGAMPALEWQRLGQPRKHVVSSY